MSFYSDTLHNLILGDISENIVIINDEEIFLMEDIAKLFDVNNTQISKYINDMCKSDYRKIYINEKLSVRYAFTKSGVRKLISLLQKNNIQIRNIVKYYFGYKEYKNISTPELKYENDKIINTQYYKKLSTFIKNIEVNVKAGEHILDIYIPNYNVIILITDKMNNRQMKNKYTEIKRYNKYYDSKIITFSSYFGKFSLSKFVNLLREITT